MVSQDTKPTVTKLNGDPEANTNQDEGDVSTESRTSSGKSNKSPVIILILLVMLGIAGYFIYISPLKEQVIQLFNQTTLNNLPVSTQPQKLKYSAQVTVTGQGFIPATLLVKQGTQVTFISKDNKLHQVASDPHPTHAGLPSFFQTKPASSFTYTFVQTGTFTYHDETNPLKTHGTVIVE